MPFEFGDVVLVPFPFTSQTASKKRPAVVVSSGSYNQSRPDIVVMAVTSQLRHGSSANEIWLKDWQAAGLLKPSVVKPVFATLEQNLVIRRLGGLNAGDQSNLRQTIVRLLS
ncbi:MAG: type II toxin-antitoxin system PemK/MazF family toxin [Rhodospirillaceae bacterium]|nr:type II toxin-antitoxin system PemK/MazF family toxin [Rhodospirillaceae bacterium]